MSGVYYVSPVFFIKGERLVGQKSTASSTQNGVPGDNRCGRSNR